MGSYIEPLRVPQEGQTIKQSKISHKNAKEFLGKAITSIVQFIKEKFNSECQDVV